MIEHDTHPADLLTVDAEVLNECYKLAIQHRDFYIAFVGELSPDSTLARLIERLEKILLAR